MEGGTAEPLNVGSTELVTIDRLIDLVEEIAGVEVKRDYDLDAPQGVRGRSSDNTRILAELGWEPAIGLKEGLERTYRWVFDQVSARVPAGR
jgi:nucleoside-diphosphate-sugar epimerase